VIAVDTNVLVYAHRRECREHTLARDAVSHLAEGQARWAIPWPCIYEFISVVTNPRIWKDAASTPAQAWSQVEAWLGSPRLALLSETPEFETVLAGIAQLPRVREADGSDARVVDHGAA
jgi:predicted nucleic acid-binding protein